MVWLGNYSFSLWKYNGKYYICTGSILDVTQFLNGQTFIFDVQEEKNLNESLSTNNRNYIISTYQAIFFNSDQSKHIGL